MLQLFCISIKMIIIKNLVNMVHGISDSFQLNYILRNVKRNGGKVIRLKMTATLNETYNSII